MAQHIRVCYIGGIVKSNEINRFKKILYRATRGKTYTKFGEIVYRESDRMTDMKAKSDKHAFIVMFEEGTYLKDRVFRICKSFNDHSFEFNIQEASYQF